MANMLVAYQGPNPALSTLVAELRATFGSPARTYEFVTGYKSPANISGHNADANGRVHSVDIFIGPGNLTEAQGIWVAEQLRQEGKRGSIPGHPDRLAYIIHRGQIAGDHTGWEWIAYTGRDWHGDHIHVSSVFDYYWGDAVAGNPADYNSTAPWGLGTPALAPKSGDITSITPTPATTSKEDDMPLTSADLEAIQGIVQTERATTVNEVRANATAVSNTVKSEAYDGKVFNQKVMNESGDRTIHDQRAQIAALMEVIKQLGTGNGNPVDLGEVYEAAKRGAEKAITDGVVKVQISLERPELEEVSLPVLEQAPAAELESSK